MAAAKPLWRAPRIHDELTICCCSPSFYLKQVRQAQSVVASGSVAYSSITAMPHELFDQSGTVFGYNKIAMSRVGVAEAKNKLPELIKAVENGERVTICRHGKPVVDIVRTSRRPVSEIEFGGLSHLKVELDPDWWKPMSKEEAEAFLEGRR